ncbi:MAG: hypothetical protein HOC74_16495 [Gemmatimonadetes bacterium]|jgi:hypothetical protein|nr:hypothetical protein [Gemmatimonadota bacterium]
MKLVETDSTSGAEIYQLTDDARPADNIYGEQPYSDPTGSRIAVRFYAEDGREGGLSILDLNDGSLHSLLTTMPRFPAFHAWGEHLYFQEEAGGELLLKRCNYLSLEREDLLSLPTAEGRFSYGTVSADGGFYAASVHRNDNTCQVLLIDLSNGRTQTLADTDHWHFKHEQFSQDGQNRILIQANSPDVSRVQLGVLQVGKTGIDWLPVDRPHTPRPTGHEAWIGDSGRVFLSTGSEEGLDANIWTAGLDVDEPTPACRTSSRFGHVSVSRCGRFWVADAGGEEGIPIYIGSFASRCYARVIASCTVHDGNQWSHTHPYLTADSDWLIFTSTRSGHPQIFGAQIREEFLEELDAGLVED